MRLTNWPENYGDRTIPKHPWTPNWPAIGLRVDATPAKTRRFLCARVGPMAVRCGGLIEDDIRCAVCQRGTGGFVKFVADHCQVTQRLPHRIE